MGIKFQQEVEFFQSLLQNDATDQCCSADKQLSEANMNAYLQFLVERGWAQSYSVKSIYRLLEVTVQLRVDGDRFTVQLSHTDWIR